MLEQFGSIFLLLGPIVIIAIGVAITIIFTSLRSGVKRWMVLFIGPILTILVAFGATYLVTTFIDPAEESGFLLGCAAVAIYFMALFLYYPLLVIVAVVQYFKKQKRLPTQNS